MIRGSYVNFVYLNKYKGYRHTHSYNAAKLKITPPDKLYFNNIDKRENHKLSSFRFVGIDPVFNRWSENC